MRRSRPAASLAVATWLRKVRTSVPIVLFALAACAEDPYRFHGSDQFGNIHWAEHPGGPILELGGPGSWNELRGGTGSSILVFRDQMWLFHSAEDIAITDRIGAHVAPVGAITGPWVPLAQNPLLDLGPKGAWDDRHVAHPMVIFHGDELWMYYSGTNGRQTGIGLAMSSDGIHWNKLPLPVFTTAPDGAWDDAGVDHPAVLFDGRQYVMAYRGWKRGDPDTHSRIGMAVSADGVHWVRQQAQPILDYGGPGQWDEYGLLAPRLWMDQGTYYMNYSGKDAKTGLSSLGHASATSLTAWKKSPANPIVPHAQTRYQEVEWGTPFESNNRFYMVVEVYFDGGRTVLWEGALPAPRE